MKKIHVICAVSICIIWFFVEGFVFAQQNEKQHIMSPNYPYTGRMDPAIETPPHIKEPQTFGDKRLPEHLRKQGWWIYERSVYNKGVTMDYIRNLKNGSLPDNIKSTGLRSTVKAVGGEKVVLIDYYPNMDVPQTALGRVTSEDKMVFIDEAVCEAVDHAYSKGDNAKYYLVLYRIPDIGENSVWGIGGAGGVNLAFEDGLNPAKKISSIFGGTGYGKGGGRFFPGSEIMIYAFGDDPEKYKEKPKEEAESQPVQGKGAEEKISEKSKEFVPDIQEMVKAQNPDTPVFHFRWDEDVLWDEITNIPMAKGQYAKLEKAADPFAAKKSTFYDANGAWTGARVIVAGVASPEGSRQHNMPLGDARSADCIWAELGKRMIRRGWTPDEYANVFIPVSAGENIALHDVPEYNRLVFFIFENFNKLGVIKNLAAK